jgi:hypothetical protein
LEDYFLWHLRVNFEFSQIGNAGDFFSRIAEKFSTAPCGISQKRGFVTILQKSPAR